MTIRKLRVLELFSGTGCISEAFKRRGHEVFRVDYDEMFEAELHVDIMDLQAADIIGRFGRPDVIWASPDCTTYSVAAISHHRTKDTSGVLVPKSEYARRCDLVNMHFHSLIMMLSPRLWFIENPRGGMRKMPFMDGLARYTITYCQYGDNRMKPTDIWTNHPDPRFRPVCRNGDPCHDRAPRSSTVRKMKEQGIEIKLGGTQYGLDNSVDRSRIPAQLCEHIVDICEE